MPLVQSIDNARELRVGLHGVADDVLKAALGRAGGALDNLRIRQADGSLRNGLRDLLGIDAFGQPAVEEGKVLAKKYLAE